MAGFDFNDTKEQSQERVHGPVPEGSKVLLELHIEKPYNQASSSNPIIDKASTGLFQIKVSYKVIAGRYEGYFWYDSILLPPKMQNAVMSDGQRKACEISEQRIRGIIEASRNVNPRDKSPAVRVKRAIQSWSELDNMVFPAKLNINPQGRDYNGTTYYHNRIGFVITPDNKEYNQLMAGGEIINEGGAVTPTQSAPKKQSQPQFDDSFSPAENITNGNLDDIPF